MELGFYMNGGQCINQIVFMKKKKKKLCLFCALVHIAQLLNTIILTLMTHNSVHNKSVINNQTLVDLHLFYMHFTHTPVHPTDEQ
jgi:hypothetical protein